MEIVILLFVLVGGSIAFSAWKKSKLTDTPQSADSHSDSVAASSIRKCLTCGYQGEMKTWIANFTAPKVILVAGFLLGYLPGIVFLAFYWGKCKCPGCGAIGKNKAVKDISI